LVVEKNFTSDANGVRQVVRLHSSPSLILVLDRKLRLTVNSDSSYLKASSDSKSSNLTAAVNVASITRAACSPGSRCSGLWVQDQDADSPLDSGKPKGWTDVNVVSAACGLYPCARHMKAEASNGRFTETIIREELYAMEIAYFV
jgi:hypothetical protein